MKNDIDALLESMFRNGKLNLKGQNNQKSTPNLVWNNENLGESTKKMDTLTEEVRSDMAELERNLRQDGVEASTAKNSGRAQEIETAFRTARANVGRKIIGQEEFLDGLTIAFKRPFIVGGDGPLCRAAIIGPNGTGRHTAAVLMTEELCRLGLLKNPKLAMIDLSFYAEADSEKVFFQDLYAALKGSASGVAFENFERCHVSILLIVSQLFECGFVQLDGRYAEQKGMLVDIGSALIPNAISRISASGKYIFLITDKSEGEIGGAFGVHFLSALDDVCKVKCFTGESLKKISEGALRAVLERSVKQLGFTLSVSCDAVEALAAEYNTTDGVEAILATSAKLCSELCEAKLKQGLESMTGEIATENGGLVVRGNAGERPITLKITESFGESAQNEAVDEVKRELSEVVGLSAVKEYILSLEDNFKVQQMRRERGLRAESPAMHMIFTGNPGTGKTTVARIVARYLKAIGVLSEGQLVEVSRADLVGKYVGHTAPLTAKAIRSALGGVLFIDEAYSLFRGEDDSFGLEAIDTLVKGMEDNRDNLLVILAGYSREMETFLKANSGLRSRFPNIIEFADYTADELYEITVRITGCKGYVLDSACKAKLLDIYEKAQNCADSRVSGNGRMARNLVEKAILNCSTRNLRLPENEQNLELLLPVDFD